jgi:UDP-glucose 4-epimerase
MARRVNLLAFDNGSMAPRRALVTGASGFIGSGLAERLTKTGMDVHAVSRRSRPDERGVVWHELDLADVGRTRSLLADISPETVFHLAGEVTGERSISTVLATLEANLVGTIGLLAGAVDAGCRRVVLAGSMEELGGPDGIPGSGYAAAKLSATTYARMLHATFGLSIVNLRLFMVYGPGQADETKVVPHTVRSFLSGTPPKLSSGTRPVDWIYVSDVVDAFLAAASATTGDDAIPIDVGSGELVTIRELVELIERETHAAGPAEFGALADRRHETVVPADLERARAHLGWEPTTPLREGLAQTIAWYRNRGS